MTASEIQHLLPADCRCGRTLLCFDELDSTNTYLKKLARSGGEDGTVVIADTQTAGRGRQGRSFVSPGGLGLYLSILLRPGLSPEQLLVIPTLAGIAVCDTIEAVCGKRPGLKWPNDVIIRDRKLCGILSELVLSSDAGTPPAVVLGIGINVSHRPEDFPEDVRPMATSLLQAWHHPVSRTALAAAEIAALDRLSVALHTGDLAPWRDRYRTDCVTLGSDVQLIHPDGSRQAAKALDIDGTFGLTVRLSDGTVTTIRSGEVSVRGLYGYV